jgi:putative hemolysin
MLIEVLIILICLFLNAVVSCFEMALISVPKGELKSLAKQGRLDALAVLHLREHPERALSILQILLTMVGALSAAVGGLGAKENLAPYFATTFLINENLADFLAILCVVVPLTYLNVVLGELVPKAVAIRYPLRITTLGVKSVLWFGKILSPFVSLLTWSTKAVIALFLPNAHKKNTSLNAQDPVEIEALTKQHQQYVMNLVAIEKRKIRDIMVNWSQVQVIRIDQMFEDITNEIYRSGHTRLPVCEGDEVIGILHTKEFLAYVSSGGTNWRSIIRPVLKVQEHQSLLQTLLQMQEKRSHMGIAFNQEGKRMGIVTLEDIIEEVVGDIFDEYDDGKIQKILASTPRLKFILPTKK